MLRSKILKRALIAACALLAVFGIAAGFLAWAGLHDDIEHADVALVPGNTVNPDGTPSARLRARLDRTLELYREKWFPAIIVSGGTGKEGYDEAVAMRDYLAARGVPAEKIILDHHGDTTYASARNTLLILRREHWRSVLVVTQYFHVPRTRLALGRFGVGPVYCAHAHFFEWRDIYSIAREVIGYASYARRSYDIPAADSKF